MEEKTKKIQLKIIREASEKAGSQAALARFLEMAPQNFNRYATGKRELPLTNYFEIKKFLDGK